MKVYWELERVLRVLGSAGVGDGKPTSFVVGDNSFFLRETLGGSGDSIKTWRSYSQKTKDKVRWQGRCSVAIETKTTNHNDYWIGRNDG